MTDSTRGGDQPYTLPFPTGYDPDRDDAGTIQDFLTHKGVAVAWVAVTRDGVAVDAATDPSAVLASYQPAVDPRAAIKAQLKALDLSSGDLAILTQAVKLLVEQAVAP